MDNLEIWNIINKYFEDNPQCLVRHHIESYNDFFKNGIFQIFKEKNPLRIQTQYDEEIDDYRHQCIMYFGGKEGNKIYFGKPVIYDDNNSHYMYPNEARLRNMTYGMTIHYDIEVEFIKHLRPGEQPNVPGLEAIEGGFKDSKKFQNLKNKITDLLILSLLNCRNFVLLNQLACQTRHHLYTYHLFQLLHHKSY